VLGQWLGQDSNPARRMEPDSGTTNIRNVSSKHWQRWLGIEYRCFVPLTSFSEFNKAAGGDIWFALDECRPLACFAGIWTNWTSVRKVKEGETTNDLFGFLTTEPNDVVGPIHPKAMPVILTEPNDIKTWLTFTRAMRDTTGNLPPMLGVFPDYMAPIVRNAPDRVRELAKARWGMPSSQFALMQSAKKRAAKAEAKGNPVDFKELLRMEPDSGTTNIRNVGSKHWQRLAGRRAPVRGAVHVFQRIQ
jgi:putative SOS response-associated peptidase YedK